MAVLLTRGHPCLLREEAMLLAGTLVRGKAMRILPEFYDCQISRQIQVPLGERFDDAVEVLRSLPEFCASNHAPSFGRRHFAGGRARYLPRFNCGAINVGRAHFASDGAEISRKTRARSFVTGFGGAAFNGRSIRTEPPWM